MHMLLYYSVVPGLGNMVSVGKGLHPCSAVHMAQKPCCKQEVFPSSVCAVLWPELRAERRESGTCGDNREARRRSTLCKGLEDGSGRSEAWTAAGRRGALRC